MPLTPELAHQPTPEILQALIAPLEQFNLRHTGVPIDRNLLAIALREPATQAIAGGLLADCNYAHMHLHTLFVPEPLRGNGLGSRVLALAEDQARRRGCVAAWLETLSFQAPGFYQRQGYSTFGQLDSFPGGHTLFFMHNSLSST